MNSDLQLGQLLIDNEIITEAQLAEAIMKQKESGGTLVNILLDLEIIHDDPQTMRLIASHYGVEYVDLKNKDIPLDVVTKIPANIASRNTIIAVAFKDDTLSVATTNPKDIHVQDEIGLVLSSKLEFVFANEKDIIDSIRNNYPAGSEVIARMKKKDDIQKPPDLIDEDTDIGAEDSEASIRKYLNQILLKAYHDRATDIHIEPFEKDLQIRFRVDGVLYKTKLPPDIFLFKDSINARIKILSNLNIAEKRLPQDGRFKVRVGNVDLDLRVSFVPTAYGEGVVLRVLNTSRLYSIEELGLYKKEHDMLLGMIQKPHGIIFITGPTGSGKTTTLYSCLSKVNTDEKKIITIEDPVEYQLKGISQIQVNPTIGLTFADGLRSMLRHDPDIMMVGEVRDEETANIAVQVALTGHLVFSTLHTNDAASGVARLIDMHVEPYLITSTVECFIAQRLIRVLCPKCKIPIKDKKEIAAETDGQIDITEDTVIYKAQGCDHCNNTGYHGRKAIYEFLPMSDQVAQLVIERASAEKIKEMAVKAGMRTLNDDGWLKVKEGITTPEEVLRVTKEKAD